MPSRVLTIDLDERELREAAVARRFPVSVSSDTPIPRRDPFTGARFEEILSHERDAVDLSRAPLPLLEGHDKTRVNVGIVTALRVTGGKLRGELVLGSSQRATELAADIGAGIVSGLSVGYLIDAEQRNEKAKRITATRWTPYEVSLTPIPADTSVGINRSLPMDETNTTPEPSDTSTTRTTDTPEALDRQRAANIVQLIERHHLPSSFASTLITEGVSLKKAGERILNELARRDEESPINSHIRMAGEPSSFSRQHPAIPGEDTAQDFHRAAIDSLLLRAGIPVAKPHAGAQDVSSSVYDLARLCLSRAGQTSRRMFGGDARGPELLKRAAGTSDFPAILEGALVASVRTGYENEPASHRQWVRVAPFSDFRPASRPILGSAPDLDKLLEHSEYKHGYFSDDGTSYSIQKYGKIVALSWEALLADNLGAFLRVQPALGQAARRLEADVVYALLALNAGAGPAMQDSTNLFHANHANLVTAGNFHSELLGSARALLRKQKAVGGGYLSLTPRFWIVPAEHETAAEVILANASRRASAEKSTPDWIASLELVVEPRLASSAAFLAADSAQIDTVELGVLEENVNGPHLESEQGFETDESRWKVRHTAGAKALDWRGMVRMPITP
jgi:HK97 family phage prohead protease